MKEWEKELYSKFVSGISHTFLLHLNVTDYVKCENNNYTPLRYYLVEHMMKNRQIVVFYNRSKGFEFLTKEMEVLFIELLNLKPPKGESTLTLPKDPSLALPLLERFLRFTPKRASEILGKKINPEKPFGVVIIGYAETIFPDGNITSQSSEDRTNVITISRWARDREIEESGNIILMMTLNKSDIANSLKSSISNIEVIKLPFPSREERLEFISYAMSEKRYKNIRINMTQEQFAAITSGLALVNIEDIIKRANYEEVAIDINYIWTHKKKILEELGGGIIEVYNPEVGFEVIGDLEYVKKYLRTMSKSILEGDVLRVPMGVLLLGPPGTGKTVVVEAFAKEMGFALVKMKNIRDPYVGMSERRQDLAYDLILALEPVVVFEDEVEGKELARGTYYSGDSGVSSRMGAKRREFMSNTRNRGRIIWFGATNRPDLMDSADLREGRYDVKIPFLIPDKEGRIDILKAILRKMALSAKSFGNEFKPKISDKELIELQKNERFEGVTGAEIERICLRAYEIACEKGKTLDCECLEMAVNDFITSKDISLYDYMTDLALQLTNFESLIPEKYRERARNVRKLDVSINKRRLIVKQADDIKRTL